MIWVGGVQGAGKSTVAQVLATAYDLPVHHVDAFTYVHLDRTSPAPPLDEQLALGPEAAADWWDRLGVERRSGCSSPPKGRHECGAHGPKPPVTLRRTTVSNG